MLIVDHLMPTMEVIGEQEFSYAVMYSGLSGFIIIGISLIVVFILLFLKDYFRYEIFISPELPILMLMCLEGMFISILSNDLMMMYLGLELQSLCLFVMASLK